MKTEINLANWELETKGRIQPQQHLPWQGTAARCATSRSSAGDP